MWSWLQRLFVWLRRPVAASAGRALPLTPVDAGEEDTANPPAEIEEAEVADARGKFYEDDDTRLLARLLYGEARGEPWEGKIAVAWTVVNRMRAPGRWSYSVRGVALQRLQYSCFNESSATYEVLENPDNHNPKPWGECLRASSAVLSGHEEDPTDGACHYVSRALWSSERAPKWAYDTKEKQRSIIGGHVFLRGVR